MKTDYGKLGREALARLRRTAGRAASVQRQLLAGLLRDNRETEYGRRYGFGGIADAEDYQRKVPLSVYGDYEADIVRIIGGEKGILTEAPAVYFCISSGTTGNPKYLPLTEKEMDIQYIYAYGIIYGMMREYYGSLPESEVFGRIFQVGEFAKTYMENGAMNGIRSGALYQWMDRDGQFDASDYCVPKEVLFPEKLEDLLYVKTRFALAERGLRAIHGVFINRVSGVMDYILRSGEILLRDMERGDVDGRVALSGEWREFIREKLPPDPARAAELRGILCGGRRRGMIRGIWPDMRYVLAIGGKSFSYYTERLKEYAGDIPIHYFAYAATEGIYGVAERVGVPDAYILFPEAGFFEFLPLAGGSGGRPHFLWEICQGERYELLFTNHSGLYRYCTGDVVEVTGWHGQAPVVRFCYRKNQVISVAGEKSNQEQLEEAVNLFARRTGMDVTGYCVQEELSDLPPGYRVYLECTGGTRDGAEAVLDECLCLVNYEYKGCRGMNEIGPPGIVYLRAGSFRRYEKKMAAEGRPMGQSKRICILDTEEKRRFFASAADS